MADFFGRQDDVNQRVKHAMMVLKQLEQERPEVQEFRRSMELHTTKDNRKRAAMGGGIKLVRHVNKKEKR